MSESSSSVDDQPKHPPSQEGETPAGVFDAENTATSPITHKQSESLQMFLSESSMYVSPLPSPRDVERMELILPGTLERLLSMAELSAKATRENEAKIVDASIADRKADRKESSQGQVFGLIVALLGFVLSGTIAALGHPVSATILGFAPLATLVSIFVVGRSWKSESSKNDDAVDN